MSERAEVVLLARVHDRDGGALLHPGESASFTPDVADDLIQRGLARWHRGPVRHEATGVPPQYVDEVLSAALDGPPADKMVDARRSKKK